MGQYLQLLRDFLAAVKGGEYWKAYRILVQIQQVIVDLFGPGSVGTMSAEEKAEATVLCGEATAALNALASQPTTAANGKIIAWLIKIGLIVIGIPLPFEAE